MNDIPTGGHAAAPGHDAVLYASREQLVAAALEFARAGLAADEGVFVVLDDDSNADVARELGPDAAVDFIARWELGPARLVADAVGHAVQARAAGGRAARVVCDALGPVGGPLARAQIAESVLADAVLDTLCGIGRPLEMLCAYPSDVFDGDGGAAPGDVLACHERVVGADGRKADARYDPDLAAALFARPLPEPSVPVSVYCSNGRPLGALREFVGEHARAAHLSRRRVEDLVLAAHEVATNSLRHAGGEPIVRMWRDDAAVICEVRDHGVIPDPMVGRLPPDIDREDGRGLWLAGHLCDLAQVRSAPATGTSVRLHVSGAPRVGTPTA